MRRFARASAFILRCARVAAASSGLWASSGHAAGGHFALDDAALLEVGQCQVETWAEREGTARSLVHAGAACRVGAVELGLNVDRSRSRGEGPETIVGPQLKWATALDDRVSIGVVASAGRQGGALRNAGASLYVPVSVRVASSLWLHVNGGRDWTDGVPATTRAGLAIEWQAHAAVLLIGERYRQSGANFTRFGVRWQASEAVSVDLSRAHGLGRAANGFWTLGVTWVFDAPGARAASVSAGDPAAAPT